MDENQKPFACTIEGCEMTFTNEDHLNWHHKKHDMVLNLGIANKNMEVDQTPTPTRFIRNCEEVGLFQDLQNVNPFDETFKKAIESGKSGLHVPDSTNDDTLHTPHIFPHVESTSVKYIDVRNDNQSTTSNEFCIDSVPSIDDNHEPNESYELTIVTDEPVKDNIKNKHNDLKNKLKETIKNKVKTPVVITPVPLEKLKLSKSEAPKRAHTSEKNDISKAQKVDGDDSDGKAKIREMNRAAQLRCRKRKQIQWKKMEEEIRILKNENVRLNYENQNFRHKFYSLKELLLKHKISKDVSVLAQIEEILNSSMPFSKKELPPEKKLPISKQKIVKNKVSKTSPTVTLPILQSPGQGVQKPVLIQVMGSVAQLAVSVLPNQ